MAFTANEKEQIEAWFDAWCAAGKPPTWPLDAPQPADKKRSGPTDTGPTWPLDAPQPTERELLEEEFRQNLRNCGPYDAAPIPMGLPEDIARGIALEEDWRRKTARPDNVNSPPHYTTGGIECFDAMRAMLTDEEIIGYLRGNSFKYRWRFRHKNGAEDLKKAEWYERKLLEIIDVSA